jgi:ferritin-like metal-binding protein YciE
MALFSNRKADNLNDLLVDELEDLYDAEKRLLDALPKMADAASDERLKKAFWEHEAQTRHQVERLEEAFRIMEKEPHRRTCEAMKGLIKEGEEALGLESRPPVKDAALIAAAQRVEHYEISGYGTARQFADRVGMVGVASLLQETLDEESETDHKLTDLAINTINPMAI